MTYILSMVVFCTLADREGVEPPRLLSSAAFKAVFVTDRFAYP